MRQSGVTLLEMLIVVTIVGVVAGVSFPAVTSGLSGVRLQSAAGSVASFLTSTMNRVDRHEQGAAIVISPKENTLAVFTAASGEKPERTLGLPQGITIEGEAPHRYLFLPGGTIPRMLVVLRNDKGAEKSIRVDPATGIPDIQRGAAPTP
ncbi:MAG TPA: prepilin-type N-terminal cleavage/methylation domain-containing protein [Bryobacteraceae bacterium]|jgi:prepilin-type N-terminal cleavage/methylation domain-containing protein|nr:prepilin-type N-terminal cleavage/methylation domain-containing protein [Bryobacteraceae bacterium]